MCLSSSPRLRRLINILPVALLVWIGGVSTLSAEELDSYPGYGGSYPGFTLVLDERFNSFNKNVWRKGDGAVGMESLCRFHPDGVQVVDGLLNLVVAERKIPAGWSEDHQQQKGTYNYYCGELRTQPDRRIRYGRIETRMKAPARETASGYISSLFTYVNEANDGHDREWEEIDIELEGIRPDKFQANLIYGINTWEWWRTRDFGAWEDKIVVGPVDEWRVYAIEWLPDRISWFIDGKLVKTLAQSDISCKPACRPPQKFPTPIPDDATDILVNFWIPNDVIQNTFGGNRSQNVYPMKAQYDWIRIYQYDAHPLSNWPPSDTARQYK